jgi:polysaccharide export outer membrane protein
MKKVPDFTTPRSIALGLVSLQTTVSALPTLLLVWAALGISPTMAQTRADFSDRHPIEPPQPHRIDRPLTPRTGSPVPLTSEPTPPLDPSFDAYRLGPGDSLFVNVFRFPDLSFQGTLDQQGHLLLPLAGALDLTGLTLDQAREAIQVALDRYIVNPQVDVILIAQRPVQVTVLGEIAKPGLYPLPAPQLITALLVAGGTTGMADLRAVRIRRTLTNGSILEQDIDLFTPLQTTNAIPDLRLADGDTIIVPALTTSNDAEYDRHLVARSTLAQQEITIRILNYAGNRGQGYISSLSLPNGSNFVDALTAIGPDLSTSNLRKIGLIRFDVEQGMAVTEELNGRAALTGDLSQNPPLEHHDVIVIGRNFVTRLTQTLNRFTQPFRDVLGFLLFFDSLADSADNLFRPEERSRRR